MMYPITIEGDLPIFLCSWEDGELVEIHTKKSLWDQYQDSGLFDPEDDGWGWEIMELMNFEGLLHHLETESMDKGRVFHNENMTIQRIR